MVRMGAWMIFYRCVPGWLSNVAMGTLAYNGLSIAVGDAPRHFEYFYCVDAGDIRGYLIEGIYGSSKQALCIICYKGPSHPLQARAAHMQNAIADP